MSISDKTRKILWAKSGNTCAICKKLLVVEANENDFESVVADECHISAQNIGGPRYDKELPKDQIDEYFNVILLCKSDHKLVDDQVNTYTREILQLIKQQHENWVAEKLTKGSESKKQEARFLKRVTSGKELFNIIDGMHGFEYDFDETSNAGSKELIVTFLQNVQDYGDIVGDFTEISQKFEVMDTLKELIDKVESIGYFLFGDRVRRKYVDHEGKHFFLNVGIIRLLNANNPTIIKTSGSS